ncbi:TonB-dependent receptor [Flavobacterium franklandianum]|uniref:TonB-dependent receptor n=1 Tax=Flavobacterium franklandianum TaxID=2594430 RepID=A0A553CMT7_9FLAO|nr:TonB-dependent receptor [Flavobacterium franklandianum]TRX21725.1 TonB-dependent receptor [Flavobacterium franklandianum]
MKIFLILCFLLSLFSGYSQIQKGSVKDVMGNPIENAYIINTNSQSHAHSNEFGNFTIDKTNAGDVFEIASLGFKKTNFTVNSNDFIFILENDVYSLDQVVILPKLNAMNAISKIDLLTAPVNSSQEVLRKIPGLFIGQHAGGGKAEQIFLRGFDIDHGTDLAISVDGIPVNMVSHAHGQGYADLHFVIPETIEKIDFGKGTYYANKGDFATAGYVAFQTKEAVDKSIISVEMGQFNTFRTVGIFNLLENKKNQNAYFATEYVLTDGPFDSPQNFKRINLFGKYTNILSDKSKFSIIVSRFSSKWDASGQIPQRLIDNGTISRFGSVYDTEGGITSRTNFNIAHIKPIDENTFIKSNVFYSNYQFELYSNFTFFLDDPINGDQIRQKENRNIYGLNTEINKKVKFNETNALFQLGFGFRADETTDTELSHTLNRSTTLDRMKLGDIDQTNIFSYLNAELEFGKLKINPAIRMDYFKFNYQDKLVATYKTQTENKVKFSPKLNFIYSQNANFQLYLKSGLGFHSNDTRVVVDNVGKDPRALLEQAKQILPTAIGIDFGTIFKPFRRLVVNTALWYLQLQEELVYVGDAATVEISGRTKRMGIDFGLRYQLSYYLFLDTDLNYTYARSIDAPDGKNYIPLAPDFTATAGLNSSQYKGFSGGFHYRYLKARPANENNSIVAKGYMVSDLNINYEYKKGTIGITAENIFNTKWNETQFATESRLKNESQSVEEIHFTPGIPFFLKAKVTYRF